MSGLLTELKHDFVAFAKQAGAAETGDKKAGVAARKQSVALAAKMKDWRKHSLEIAADTPQVPSE